MTRTGATRRGGRGAGQRSLALIGLILFAGAILVPPTAAQSAGSLAPPHADAGVDTNGDRLFNFLRIDVSIQVSAPGTFTVQVLLKDDLDLAMLSQASITVSLAAGPQKAAVLIDGPDIYNGGVDGPYYAHLVLLSDSGTTLATGVHATAAYGFTDFQPYAARIVPPMGDRTLDNDTDGLADWLDVTLTVDVATAGTYSLVSHLTERTYSYSADWEDSRILDLGRHAFDQLFLGYPIRLSGRSGPYMVTNSLYDARGSLIDFLFVETSAYNYTTFELPPARLAPPHHEALEDPDLDGLANALRIDVSLLVDSSGTFTLRGQLMTGGGALVQETVARLTLVPGTPVASLRFSGSAIRDSSADGPYLVELEVYDFVLRKLDAGTYWTGAYAREGFEPTMLYLDPPHEDAGVDLDGNGLFEALRFFVHVNVSLADEYGFHVAIRKGLTDLELANATRSVFLSTGRHVVPLDLDGADLLGTGLNGPYRVWVQAYDRQGTLIEEGNQRTAAYNLSQFEAGATGRIVGLAGDSAEDTDGDGLYNRLWVRILVNVSGPGRYRLEGTLSKSGLLIGVAGTVCTLPGGSGVIEIAFAGPEIRRTGLDGPYEVAAVLSSPAGSGPLDESVLVTSVYLASAFDYSPSVILTGRVVSDFRGRPLGGASVLLVDYENRVSTETFADADGNYSIEAFAGTYWIAVDHAEGQAELFREDLRTDFRLDVSLALPRRDIVEADLTWTGWDRLLITVRYAYHADGPILRLRMDWVEGDRDGIAETGEASGLVQPSDLFRGAVDSGDTGSRLLLNGGSFASTGGASWTDGISAPIGAASVPTKQVSRPFSPAWTVGMPPRVQIALETYQDSVYVDRRTRLYVPGVYRFVSSNHSDSLLVAARKIPFVVDPGVPPAGVPPDSVVSVELLLYTQTSYAFPTPSPPPSLVATTSGPLVTLNWVRPATNVDGSRLANLAGYFVYRRTGTGGYVRVNTSPVTAESLSDEPGTGTFQYAVAAVNTDGVEGPLSGPVQVTVSIAKLTVSVVDARGAPLAEAKLALAAEGSTIPYQATTDGSGLAVFVVSPGAYVLRVALGTRGADPIPLNLEPGEVFLVVTVLDPVPGSSPSPWSAAVLIAVLAFAAGFVVGVSVRRRRRHG